MDKVDFQDKHRKFNEDLDAKAKSFIERESKILENFLKLVVNGKLESIPSKLNKYKKVFLKKDSTSFKKSYLDILKISINFAKIKLNEFSKTKTD